MTSHHRPIPSAFDRNLGKALPVAVSILIWFFAATFETGYVAVLNTGIHQADQSRTMA